MLRVMRKMRAPISDLRKTALDITFKTGLLPEDTTYLIVVAGPTAVGKTAVALALARQFGTAVISADSRQCYREMNIGTAKPDAAELAAVPHYFINSHSVKDPVNAAEFEKYALAQLERIFRKNKVAVLCGGTGLYIKAVCEGMDEMPEVDREIADSVQASFNEKGMGWLREKVAAEDPEFYAQGEIQNPARLLRALAFKRSSGRSILHYQSGQIKKRPFNVIPIALDLPREELYAGIDQRVDKMMRAGLLEEVRSLLPWRSLRSLNTVGYSELFDCLEGKMSLEEAVGKIKQHTRNYAKRQLTWFRKDRSWHWFRPDQPIGDMAYLWEGKW